MNLTHHVTGRLSRTLKSKNHSKCIFSKNISMFPDYNDLSKVIVMVTTMKVGPNSLSSERSRPCAAGDLGRAPCRTRVSQSSSVSHCMKIVYGIREIMF